MIPEALYDNIDEMISLSHTKVETLRKMKRCLRIADLLGEKPSDLSDQHISIRVQEGTNMFMPWLKAVLIVTVKLTDDPVAQAAARRLGYKEQRTFPLKDVHHELWPDDLLHKFKRWQRAKEKSA